MIHWIEITSEQVLDEAIRLSESRPVLFFKHSPRCGISSTALTRLEREWPRDSGSIETYMINVLSGREYSNRIAEMLQVKHESPQALLVRNQKCVYYASHLSIRYKDMEAAIKN